MNSKLSGLSPGNVQSVSVLSVPLKVAGVALFALASSTAIWAATAQIPIKISAVGVLTPVDGLFVYQSKSSGEVLFPFRISRRSGILEFEAPPWAQSAYNFSQLKDTQSYSNAKGLAIEILSYIDQLESQRLPTDVLSGGIDFGGKSQIELGKGDVVAFIDQPDLRQNLKNQILTVQKTIATYNILLSDKRISLSAAQKLSKTKQELVIPIANLLKQGYTSKFELLEAESSASFQNNATGDIKSQLDNLSLQITQQKLLLAQTLSNFIEQSIIFTHEQSFVKTFMVQQWDYVSPGSEIAAVSWSKEDPTIIPVFFDQKSATEINVGQKAILTPLGFSIAEVGGIVGEVVTLEPLPFTSAVLAQRLQSQGLSQIVSPTGVSYQANIRLSRRDLNSYKQKLSSDPKFKTDNLLKPILTNSNPDTSGGYLWDNKSKPPVKPREGFILSAQITTRSNTPLQMMIPFLKELFGKAPVTKLVHTQINQP